MNKNQNGFSVVEAILLLVIISLIGFVGWYAWRAQQSTDKGLAAGTSATAIDKKQTKQPSDTTKLPEGWVWYEGDGFKFGYPKIFKDFTSDGMSYPASGTQAQSMSGTPDTTPFPGLATAPIVLSKLKATDTPITSRKYGPTIKLENNKWVVTQTNPSDVKSYKVGDIYGDVITKTQSGTPIYVFTSGDEGSLIYTLAFVSAEHLYTLQLPEFDTGTYDDAQTLNSLEPYDQFVAQVIEHVIVR